MGLVPTLAQITSGDADDPSRDMANWNAIRNVVNGNITNTNIAAAAAIAISKTALGTFTAWAAWTPTIYGATVAGAGTYSIQTGRKCQIGNVVYFTAYCSLTNHTGTGSLRMSAPATSANTTDFPIAIYVSSLNIDAAAQGIQAYVTKNSTEVVPSEVRDNAGAAAIAIDTACSIRWGGFYEV